MRVLLLQARRRSGFGLNAFIVTEPLGLEVVAASLKDHDIHILDLFNERDVVKEINTFKPQAVGISCSFTTDIAQTISLAKLAKSIDPEIFTFIGGHHPSRVPEDFFYPFINTIVIGDGEYATSDLINALEGGNDLIGISGTAINTPDGQIMNPERPLVMDLNALPFPARNLTEGYRKQYYLGTRYPIITMETSRGCPYKCDFCSVWRFHRGTVRSMDPERVLEEIKSLGRGDVFFTDDNFLGVTKKADQVAKLIEKNKIQRRYIIQARSDSIVKHPELIKRWASIGLHGVFIGFEKTDQSGLNSHRKRTTPQDNEKALNLLRSLGVSVYASFIVDPSFSRNDFENLYTYTERLKIKHPFFTVLTPLPGTELYQRTKEEITSTDCRNYDLLHAILPTKLPLEEFYQELAKLYRKVYFQGKVKWALFTDLVASLVSGRISILHLTRLRKSMKMLINPEAYFAKAHTAQTSSEQNCR